jgi:hypothetical protein
MRHYSTIPSAGILYGRGDVEYLVNNNTRFYRRTTKKAGGFSGRKTLRQGKNAGLNFEYYSLSQSTADFERKNGTRKIFRMEAGCSVSRDYIFEAVREELRACGQAARLPVGGWRTFLERFQPPGGMLL